MYRRAISSCSPTQHRMRYPSSSGARDSQRRRLHRRNRRMFEKEFGGVGSNSANKSRAVKNKQTRSRSAESSSNTTASSSPPFFSNPLGWYSSKLESHPFTTKCITSGFIAGSGDFLCQYLVHRNKLAALQAEEDADLVESTTLDKDDRNNMILEVEPAVPSFRPDLYRTSRFGILGFALVAPVVHLWYGTLMTRFPGTTVSAVLKRTFFDQAFFAPIFLPTFMINLMMLEGRPFGEVQPKLEKDLPDALIANWSLWCPAMLINFRFVPLKYQVLYSNMVGFVWNTYLSFVTQEGEEGEGDVKDKEILAESHM